MTRTQSEKRTEKNTTKKKGEKKKRETKKTKKRTKKKPKQRKAIPSFPFTHNLLRTRQAGLQTSLHWSEVKKKAYVHPFASVKT